MKYFFLFATFLLGTMELYAQKDLRAIDGASASSMVDINKINDPSKEWCYTPKSTTVIGVPFMPRPIQVTYDGAIVTGDAELCFFYGEDLKPFMGRQKTFYEGWMPLVQFDFADKGLKYEVEMFSSEIEGVGAANTLQYVQVRVTNTSNRAMKATVSAASRYVGADHRISTPKGHVAADVLFESKDNAWWRDGKLIYAYPDKAVLQSVPTEAYKGSFKAGSFKVDTATAAGMATSEKLLSPGQSVAFVYWMPAYPLDKLKDKALVRRFSQSAFKKQRISTIAYWKDLIGKGTSLYVPEKRVRDSYRASLVHLILATRNQKTKRQGSGLPYDDLFLIDYVDMRRLYDVAGLPEFVTPNVQWLKDLQTKDGYLQDPVLTHGEDIMASHGQALVSLANHVIYTRDTVYARSVYPNIQKAVQWMLDKHAKDLYGLMPPSLPYDAEMIKGYYTSHNLYCLLALRDAIRVARILGEKADVEKWMKFHEGYKEDILTAIDVSTRHSGGYVPTGLYHFITGEKARKGFAEYRTDQDWENNLLVYPTEVLEPSDKRVIATVDTIRKKKYREGIMTYRNGMHLHQYATVNQAHQYLILNNQRQTLLDMYHILLHNGSTHEGFENMVEPWANMDPWPIPAPHAWAAAKTGLLLRNMLVLEHGGEAGIRDNERNLYLFSVLSPSWVRTGEHVGVTNALTEMGKITADMKFTQQGAIVSIKSNFHTPPGSIKIAIPYFVALKNVKTNAKTYKAEDGYMVFSPDVTEINISWIYKPETQKDNLQQILLSYRRENSLDWTDKENPVIIKGGNGFLTEEEKQIPAAPLSFSLVKQAFLKEYQRRFDQYIKAGKKPVIITPQPAK